MNNPQNWKTEKLTESNSKPTLLILAGGLGSRYKGQKQTDSVSDSGEKLMEFALYDALKAGIGKFVFIVNSQFPDEYKEYLNNQLSNKGGEVHFVEQTIEKYIPEKYLHKLKDRSKPLGTGHAVYCAKEVIDGPFVTLNADDFYGRNSFGKAAKWIDSGGISVSEYGMIAFELQNTLSENGSVSRGICQTQNRILTDIEEYTSIEKKISGIWGNNEEGVSRELHTHDKVSMNLWILHPSFFDRAEKDLTAFLENNEDLTAKEFYLPTVIGNGIQDNSLKVQVLQTDEKWFGLTYPQDKEAVVKEISKMKKEGFYPEFLWE